MAKVENDGQTDKYGMQPSWLNNKFDYVCRLITSLRLVLAYTVTVSVEVDCVSVC